MAASEAHLLALAQGLFDAPASALVPLLANPIPVAPRIGPTAMGILERTLARGSVKLLARGGWRRERRPVGERVVDGRIWERHGPPAPAFTEASWHLLRWLAGTGIGRPAPARAVGGGTGDALLGLLVAELLVAHGRADALGGLAAGPLVQLGLAWWVEPAEVDWAELVARPVWLEGLSNRLASAWVRAEQEKAATRSPARVIEGSRRQAGALAGFLAACGASGRVDLADFLLDVVERLVPDPSGPVPIGADVLDRTRPLAERSEARRMSGPLLDAIAWRSARAHADRSVRFFDDDYDAAQARLARWERFGEARAAAARARSAALAAPVGAVG